MPGRATSATLLGSTPFTTVRSFLHVRCGLVRNSIEPPGIDAVLGVKVRLDGLPVEERRVARFDKGNDPPSLPAFDRADGFLEPPGQFNLVDVAFDGRRLIRCRIRLYHSL